MFARVLVLVDFSAASLHALRVARRRFPRADFSVLYVIEAQKGLSEAFRTPSAGIGSPHLRRDRAREDWEEVAARRLARLGGGEVEWGDPAEQALSRAKRGECDLIVLGVKERGRLETLLFGSVASRVLQDSPVPVLTVRAPPRGSDPAAG